jgi:hypothetical protein
LILLLAGSAVLVITILLFWQCMPHGGKTHRFVGTELEAYVGVAFTSAVAIGFTMILSAVLDLMS